MRAGEEAQRQAEAKAMVIPLLQKVQESLGYIPEDRLRQIAQDCGVSEAEVFGVVTFYKQFRLQPQGRYVVKVCNGTACHVNGAAQLESAAEEVLGIHRGESDAKLHFTLESVNCVGCCSLAPVVMVNGETHGSLTSRKLRSLLAGLRRKAEAEK